MSNKTYWNDRDKARFEYIRQNLADDKAFNTSLEKYYQRTIDAINKDIQSELQSFATRDGVSLAEARKKVSKADVRQFEAEAKKVVKEADQMRKKSKRVSYSDFSDEVNERMRLYNVTMRINRLEYLKSLIGVRLIELGVDINNELNVKLDEDTRNELERQSGILAGAGMADAMDWWTEENVQKIVMSNTRSANFSARIWSNVDVLKSELEKQLSRVLISGENPKATAKEFYKHMTKDVGNMRAAAERIARTESARCQTQATLESFKEYDVKYCRWIAEPRACVVCKEIASHSSGNGVGVYPVKDVPELPQHPNCRCALSAYWKKREELSRDEIGAIKSYKSSESYKINYALRHKEKLSEAQRDLVMNLDNAIDKLPKYSSESPLYRSYSNGLGFDVREFAAKVVDMRTIEDLGYFSTSREIYNYDDDLRVIILNSHSGAVLGKYDETKEKEILFARKSSFKVVKYYLEERSNNKLVPIIEVVENE
jgi:SPP1 gp7 family putative phage head morphogenesis protein